MGNTTEKVKLMSYRLYQRKTDHEKLWSLIQKQKRKTVFCLSWTILIFELARFHQGTDDWLWCFWPQQTWEEQQGKQPVLDYNHTAARGFPGQCEMLHCHVNIIDFVAISQNELTCGSDLLLESIQYWDIFCKVINCICQPKGQFLDMLHIFCNIIRISGNIKLFIV